MRFATDAGGKVGLVAGEGSVGSGGFVVGVVVVESSAAGVIVMLGIIVKVNMVRCDGGMGRE